MHIVIVNYVYSPGLSTSEQLLNRYFSLRGWVDGLIAAGVKVTVFQRFHLDAILISNSAEYYFISDTLSPNLSRYQIPFRLHKKIRGFLDRISLRQGEIVLHINGLLFPLQTFHLLISISRQNGCIVQHHAENPKKGIGRIIQRIGLRYVDGFLFSTKHHVKDWKKAGIIHNRHMIGEVMETSSILKYEDRVPARRRTRLYGNPLLLWTGNLNSNKDPITILQGLKVILKVKPYTRLYMAYRNDEMLSEVKEYILSDHGLSKAVILLGRIPYPQINSYYNSADFFVQGSHREGSGIALLDALACGVVPVVTDIPSFRVITDSGRVGALWPVDDFQSFAEALLSVVNQPIEQLSIMAREQFENHFSFEKLAELASEFYAKIIRQKSQPS